MCHTYRWLRGGAVHNRQPRYVAPTLQHRPPFHQWYDRCNQHDFRKLPDSAPWLPDMW